MLKVIRQSGNLTQEELAERLSVDVTTIQGWESGRRPLMAVSAGTYLRIRHFLLRNGTSPRLLSQLDTAMEADRFIGYVLSHEGPLDLDAHPLASWVITRPFTDLIGWTFTGTAPSALASAPVRRRGPVPPGPRLAADERNHVITHLRAAAEQAALDTTEGALLRRQAHYVAGFDSSSETVEWLAVMQRAEQRRLRPGEWSPSWAVVRSGAHTLARRGDAEALPRFIGVHIETDQCEIANLNYWAYWLGELADPQLSDAFMIEVDLDAWHGGRLVEHLTTRLDRSNPYVDVVAHTLWSLVHRKPGAVTPTRGRALAEAVQKILEEGGISPQSRRELQEVLYALRIVHRR
ncbi:helix-turn-helix domain-containing protein [Streptomonospora sp. S1-112]|uniref:Helix-turn-helix domain-containing protein n=1 Tax=Streptomonospora mangrovi TaxID=2883123 RepID=A0A9X3SDJ1_9ACTN|nr:helix-turn-helix transcriptional regulator [Streptomonospora mangrovi]MDA0564868.1 helix-turn-helix domain-containing protein [Streptomonospora mangrovi]